MTKMYIIPGFEHDASSEAYRPLVELFLRHDFEPVPLKVQWSRTALDDWLNEVELQINRYSISESYVFGFSFGALIALIIASRQPVKGLLLGSLSPYFAEYLATLPDSWKKTIGIRRVSNFEKYRLADIVSKINCPTWVFVGESEARAFPQLQKQAKDIHELIGNSVLIDVLKGKHDIGQDEYIMAIGKVLDSF